MVLMGKDGERFLLDEYYVEIFKKAGWKPIVEAPKTAPTKEEVKAEAPKVSEKKTATRTKK